MTDVLLAPLALLRVMLLVAAKLQQLSLVLLRVALVVHVLVALVVDPDVLLVTLVLLGVVAWKCS